ncbi:transferrin-binding protein-like solute binding protein [Glaesserella sp.]|uniref:transferrin-binding protein-like solute binding protein n=1 Tax=Glaesserella sp. TaxID=2094731 RepID=UPI0035A0F08A
MKRLVFSFPISLILALTACGGSGGSGNSAGTTVQPDTTSTTSANQTNNSSTVSETQNTENTSVSTVKNDTQNDPYSANPLGETAGTKGSDPNTVTEPPATNTISGHYNEFVQFTVAEQKAHQEVINLEATSDLNKLNIGETTIDLLPVSDSHLTVKTFIDYPNIFVKEPRDDTDSNANEPLRSTNYMTELLVGADLEHVRYGVVSNRLRGTVGPDIAATAFVQGHQTPSDAVPTMGKINYFGHALVYTNSWMNTPYGIELTADFDNKVIEGDLGLWNFLLNDGGAGPFQAKITGNTFQTERRQVAPHSIKYDGTPLIHDVVVQGAFYGPQAEEVAGTFYSGWEGGAFGAKKIEGDK